MLCSRLHRLCNTVSPPASAPHMCCLLFVCLFFCLFTFVIGTCAACFVCLFPLLVVSIIIDRQQANANSDCTHCIRQGLGRRLRSSLLLNPSPRCDLPCRIVYLMF